VRRSTSVCSPRLRLTVVLVLVALTSLACQLGGTTAEVPTPTPVAFTPTPTATRTPTATPDPSLAVAPNPPGGADVPIGTDAHGLHVQVDGFIGNGAWDESGFFCGDWDVLAAASPSATTYTSADIAAIQTYFNTAPLGPNHDPLPSASTPLPSALRLVSAARSDDPQHLAACAATYAVTNNSSRPVTVNEVGVALNATPIVNRYQYALLDACTINFQRYCEGFGGSIGGCQFFVYISMATAPFSRPVTSLAGCPSATITPGQTINIFVEITPPATADNLLYKVSPQLTITDTSTHTVILTTLPNTLVYADRNQFSCYGLQGTHFVSEGLAPTPGAPKECV